MNYRITIEPDKTSFTANADEPILDAALRQGLLLPHGCRSGSCGLCRGRVLSGSVDHGAALPHVLSPEDRAAGLALLCCAKAQGDVTIEARSTRTAPNIVVKTLPARIERMVRATPDVTIIELKLPANEQLPFVAGQYVDILLRDGRRRAFSLANAPRKDGRLELHIRRIPGGQFTGHVFTAMKERDLLRINGPHGSFFLRDDAAKPLLFVATGTGIAPVRAVVEQALADGVTRPISIYWGLRRPQDIYLPEQVAYWNRMQPAVRCIPVLSKVQADDAWTGRTGYVQTAVLQDFPDLSGHQVYACGSPAMIAAARRDFVAQCGLPEDEFFADAFEFAADTRTPATTLS